MKPVNWGILSVSGHYRLRVQMPLNASSLVTVRGIASRSLEKARAAAAEFGIAQAYGSYEDLLKDSEIEAVYIPLPNHRHAEWVKKAADAGKHILCEKPFAMDAKEAAGALDYAAKRGVLVMEAFMYRLHPQWRRVKELVHIGDIGSINAVHTVFTYNNTDPKNIRNILEAGGGGIPDIGCYAVSTSRFVLGREPRRVISLVNRDPDFGTDVLASAILDFGGPRAVFTVGTQTHPVQSVDILGTSGSITVPLPFNMFPDVGAKVIVTTKLGTRTLDFEPRDQYAELFEGFSRAVRGEAPLPTPPEDAVNNMRVLDALFRSERSGAWEQVS